MPINVLSTRVPRAYTIKSVGAIVDTMGLIDTQTAIGIYPAPQTALSRIQDSSKLKYRSHYLYKGEGK